MTKLATAAAAAVAVVLAVSAGMAQAAAFQEDSMGPIRDVTKDWLSYQPASAFCIKVDVSQYTPGGAGATATGRNRACQRSGFPASATNLVKIAVHTPPLCPGCRRLFIDFSKIPAHNALPNAYAHGHVYYRLASFNFTYTVDPIAHSPNTKNFTNDKLIAPSGSPQERLVGALDLHQVFAYVSDTAHFIHTAVQGPYYIGPWYLNRSGQRINGVYLDVDVAGATRFPSAQLNEIGYGAGFNSGQMCPSDDDAFYGGCFDWGALSATTVDPFAG
jgi:hypothetical protein